MGFRWQKLPSTSRLYDGDGNHIAKVIDHTKTIEKLKDAGCENLPRQYVWFFVNDPLDAPVRAANSRQAAEEACMALVGRGITTLVGQG